MHGPDRARRLVQDRVLKVPRLDDLVEPERGPEATVRVRVLVDCFEEFLAEGAREVEESGRTDGAAAGEGERRRR
jgi:hypothetical protein